MNIAGIIPARFASSRFPGKPLIDIGGKTMIRRVYEQAKKASSLSEVIVATDDKRIYDEVMSFGGTVVMTGAQHNNGTERCAEVASNLKSPVDAIINIQGDEPFIHPEQIDALAALFANPECSIATLIKECADKALLEKPSIIKVTVNKRMEALYFSRSMIPYQRDAGVTPIYFKHIGMYGYRPQVLKDIVKLRPSPLEIAESLEQLRWLENGYKINTAVTAHESMSIDTPDDLTRLKEIQ